MSTILLKALEQSHSQGFNVIHFAQDFKVLDMGVEAQGGWSAGKVLVEAGIEGLGYVNYGEFYLNGFALPTVDVYYDNPTLTGLPLTCQLEGQVLFTFKNSNFSYAEVNQLPDKDLLEKMVEFAQAGGQQSFLVITKPTCLVAAVYSAARAVPLVLEELLGNGLKREEIMWAWGTSPLPPITDDLNVMANRKSAALQYGAVTSFWVRAEEWRIRETLDKAVPYGEIRIHSLSDAKTLVKGSVDKARLRELLLS